MSTLQLTLEKINHLNQEEFVAIFSGVYEHSPWIPREAFHARPFRDLAHLATSMQQVVHSASYESQIQLIREHPELAGKAAIKKQLTDDSLREQSGAGLDSCSEAEFLLLNQLNQDYNAKFGFPFILAVKGYQRAEIIENFSQRLNNEVSKEFLECIHQIGLIARFRLENLVL
jgi:2-oxo-4-hydroxy-4-carboxy-5-ureidoimidazoline decarboxylase